uniref:Uncharacterized protein n=1 Tax=Anguilla anguilla TaxID=7936 RepID=A0A0E9X3G8_ANGAN
MSVFCFENKRIPCTGIFRSNSYYATMIGRDHCSVEFCGCLLAVCANFLLRWTEIFLIHWILLHDPWVINIQKQVMGLILETDFQGQEA